jgi:hypothetical protein
MKFERGTRVDLVWLTYRGAMRDAATPQARQQANEVLTSSPKITLVLQSLARALCFRSTDGDAVVTGEGIRDISTMIDRLKNFSRSDCKGPADQWATRLVSTAQCLLSRSTWLVGT